MVCFLSVNRPTWFPIIIYLLFVITILSIYFYSVKLLLTFTFWSMLCLLVANIYADILYLFIARAVVFLRGCRKGWGQHMLVNVHGSEFYLSDFYFTVFRVFDLQTM